MRIRSWRTGYVNREPLQINYRLNQGRPPPNGYKDPHFRDIQNLYGAS